MKFFDNFDTPLRHPSYRPLTTTQIYHFDTSLWQKSVVSTKTRSDSTKNFEVTDLCPSDEFVSKWSLCRNFIMKIFDNFQEKSLSYVWSWIKILKLYFWFKYSVSRGSGCCRWCCGCRCCSCCSRCSCCNGSSRCYCRRGLNFLSTF